MVIEVDQEVPRERIAALEQEEGIEKVIYLCLEEIGAKICIVH